MTAMSEPTDDDLKALKEQVTKLANATNEISKALGAAAEALGNTGSLTTAASPSPELVLDQMAAERDAINAHTDSLTTKAGLVLGFAGVLFGPSATAQQVDLACVRMGAISFRGCRFGGRWNAGSGSPARPLVISKTVVFSWAALSRAPCRAVPGIAPIEMSHGVVPCPPGFVGERADW
jgi:hypothetical protein